MRPKPSTKPVPDQAERDAAILAENATHDARIDEKPFDLEKELGFDPDSKEFRGYLPRRKR